MDKLQHPSGRLFCTVGARSIQGVAAEALGDTFTGRREASYGDFFTDDAGDRHGAGRAV